MTPLRKVLACVTVACLVACGSACKKESAPAPAPTVVVDRSPVPPPDALVADVSARGPDALWGKLQQGVGGSLAHLPGSVGGALAATAGLDPTLAGEIDGAAAAYAVVAHPGPTFGWVVAMKLRDEDHARAALLGGKQPRFTGRAADGGLTVLAAAVSPGATPPGNDAIARGYVVALSPLGYLVAARSEADLVTLAPYATRTLPGRPVSPHALVVTVTHAALAGAIRDELISSVSTLRGTAVMLDAALRRQHGGRAPDFGDPTAVIDGLDDYARGKIALLADLGGAVVTLDAGDDDVTVEVSLSPGAGPSAKVFDGLKVGDAAPLLTLSADTEAAVLFNDDPASLAAGAKTAEDRAAAVFKPALGPKDTAAIDAAFSRWAATRGPWLTVGLELDGGPALTLRTPTADPEHAMQGVTDLVGLAHVPAFRSLLEANFSVLGVSTATATVPGVGATSIATFRRAGAAGAAEVAIAWAAAGDLLHVAAAGSSARALRASKDPARLLGSDVALAGKLGTLRDRASFVFAGHRLADLGPDGRRPGVVLGLGRDKTNGWALLEADDVLVREALARWLDL